MIKMLVLMVSMAVLPEPGKPGSILYFKTATCGWCDKFERETRPLVQPIYAYYAENNAEAVHSYGINGFPAFIVFDKDGTWRKHEGFLDEARFKTFVRSP